MRGCLASASPKNMNGQRCTKKAIRHAITVILSECQGQPEEDANVNEYTWQAFYIELLPLLAAASLYTHPECLHEFDCAGQYEFLPQHGEPGA